ncbi:MAG: SurA N-terminal domain-containing protein [Bacteriovoracaceae bacterium]|nr:SurA N-terminal domain-containing protein [Bacteriovoracaceae bacterium]
MGTSSNKNFVQKSSSLILLTIVGVLVLSFVLSGLFGDRLGMPGQSNSVATVDGVSISVEEYQKSLQSMLKMYGAERELTSKEMEALHLKEIILNGLIQQKIISNFMNKMNVVISKKEIKNEIRKLPYFQKEGKFDLGLYRQLGKNTSLLEKQVIDYLKKRQAETLLQSLIVSKNYLNEINELKNKKIKIDIARIPLKSFESPVLKEKSIDSHVKDLELHIKSFSKLESLKQKYNMTLMQNKIVNPLSNSADFLSFTASEIAQLFKEKNKQVFVFRDASFVTLVNVKSRETKSETNTSEKVQLEVQQINSLFQKEFMSALQKKAKIKVSNNIM